MSRELEEQDQLTIATTGNANIVGGTQLQLLPWPAGIRTWFTQDATGLTGRFTVGDQVISNRFKPNIRAAQGVIIDNEDRGPSAVANRNDNLILEMVNISGVARQLTFKVKAVRARAMAGR